MSTTSPPLRTIARGLLPVVAALSLARPAPATWSIVAIDTRTGEICVAGATCLTLDLEVYLPVVRVGAGAACAQSAIDSTGVNRTIIWNGLIAGETAEEIMADLFDSSPQINKQYGIVTLQGEPVTHSGPNVGFAKYGIARTIEGISYSIQGNVLAGIQVITDAENAFLVTEGDLGQKVLAAMEAARSYGGDGRCSCDPIHPTNCGCPPPAFVLSDQTAFFLLARQGDVDGTCDALAGCGTGAYFANLDVIGFSDGIDPVVALQAEYAAWRAGLDGRTDQLRSRVVPADASLPADGESTTTVDVELRDIDDQPVLVEGLTLSVERAYDGPPVAKLGAPEAVAPGRFRIPVRAGRHAGVGRWRLTVHHPDGAVLLWPELSIPVGAPAPEVVR